MITYLIFIIIFFIFSSIIFISQSKIEKLLLKIRIINLAILFYFSSFFIARLFISNPIFVLDIIFAIIPFITYNIMIMNSKWNNLPKKIRIYSCIIHLIAFLMILSLSLFQFTIPSADINTYYQSWIAEYYNYVINSNRATLTGVLMLIGYLSYLVAIIYKDKTNEAVSMVLLIGLPIFIIITSLYDENVAEFIKRSVLNQIIISQMFCLIIFISLEILYYYILAVALLSLAKPIRTLSNNLNN